MTKTEMLMAKSMGAGRSLKRKDKMNDDQISRQEAIDLWEKYHPTIAVDAMQYDAELRQLPSAQQVRTQMSSADCISRQDAIDAADRADYTGLAVEDVKKVTDEVVKEIKKLPSAQPTLYGYNIEHLALIATVLQKEHLPPERVVEALTDIGRIASIIRAECEEELKKAVERCTI